MKRAPKWLLGLTSALATRAANLCWSAVCAALRIVAWADGQRLHGASLVVEMGPREPKAETVSAQATAAARDRRVNVAWGGRA